LLVTFRISNHARQELIRRKIPEKLLMSVLHSPQQIVEERDNKRAYQSQVDFGHGRIFLLRAIVVDDKDPAIVVTVYRTNKIEKYWRSP